MKTEAAQTAQAIRTELKAAFPTVKFSVTSDNFSGGNSVRISWNDGPTVKAVDAITRKYQYGHFNGMEDIYECSNTRNDIPQVRFVSTSRSMTPETKARITSELQAEYGLDFTDDKLVMSKLGRWPDSVVHVHFSELAI